MIDAVEAGILDHTSPDAQKVALGTELKFESDYGSYVLTCAITADGTAEKAVVIPFACRVNEIAVECTAASAGGTLKLKKGSNDISDAIICAVDKIVTRAGTIDDAYSTLAAGDAVSVDAGQAGDRGVMTIFVRRV
jgi:hypothetical protein